MSPGLLLLALSALAVDGEEEASARASTPAGVPDAPAGAPPDDEDNWIELKRDGVHLTVDFTAAWERFFPAEDERELPVVERGEQGHPEVPVKVPEEAGGSLSFFVLPDVRYNPEEGLGLGLAIPIVWSEPDVKPYKYNFVFQLVTSTKLVQDQALLYDIVQIFGFPVRISGQMGFYAFADEPFCGVGSTASCDPQAARTAADTDRLAGPAAAEQIERFYLMRLVRPYNWTILRVELFELFGKWEVFGGLRSEWYFPGFFGNVFAGNFFDSGPYEGSLFEKRNGLGEPGYINLPQVGLMLDSRDFEPSPRAGYWIEASLRGAHPWALSSWAFAGGNITGRFYIPLHPSRRLTLATRFLADLIVGDAPVQELARFGGSQDFRGFGGRWVGRGMRQQRFIGNLKLAHQSEVRWDAVRFDVSGFSLGFEFVTFLDAGVVMAEGVDYQGLRVLRRPRPLLTVGGGLRWVINRNIVIRADVGVSPEEGFTPLFYFDGRHIF